MAKRLKNVPGAAGVDEAGRGPLAGPVVVAAVILPPKFKITGLNDSKQLTAEERNEQAKRLRDSVTDYCVVEVWPEEIDRLNILWATMAGMERAVAGLSLTPTSICVDGNRVPRGLEGQAEAIIKGDGKIACIAAASILAKTHRDALMAQLSEIHPGYGFEHNFGYPTPDHFEALRRLGPCSIHRRSFAPVRDALQPEQPCLISVL